RGTLWERSTSGASPVGGNGSGISRFPLLFRLLLPYLAKSFPKLRPVTPELQELAGELRRDVEVIAGDIGPRGVFAPERYRLAEQFLTSVLERAGFTGNRRVFEATIQDGPVECANLEATLGGVGLGARRVIVLGAHYDSVPGCPAANDNGSGVAGVLA